MVDFQEYRSWVSNGRSDTNVSFMYQTVHSVLFIARESPGFSIAGGLEGSSHVTALHGPRTENSELVRVRLRLWWFQCDSGSEMRYRPRSGIANIITVDDRSIYRVISVYSNIEFQH